MSSAELENLAKIDKLKREPPSARELQGLRKLSVSRLVIRRRRVAAARHAG
jgi:hypothetical protein